MKVVVFLQNAWSAAYAGKRWPRLSWLAALWRSRSGQRLRILTQGASSCVFWFDNTTKEVGLSPNSRLPANLRHVRRVLFEQRPGVVVAMGRQAAASLRHLGQSPLLILPHPTYRLLTNELLKKAVTVLEIGFTGVVELRQAKGLVEVLHA